MTSVGLIEIKPEPIVMVCVACGYTHLSPVYNDDKDTTAVKTYRCDKCGYKKRIV